MKKITLAFVLLLLSKSLGFSQANIFVEAPLNQITGSVNRGPNGTAAHSYVSGCYLVSQAELMNIPSGTSLTSFGFTLAAGVTAPVSGNFTVYLQHTNDLTYQKGTAFNTAVSNMTTSFTGILTLPVSAASTSVAVTLSSPFTYTGGALYVAYNWSSTGPFSGTASYLGETTVMPLPVGGGGIFTSAVSAIPTLTLTNARPSFLFGFTNNNSNDLWVSNIDAPSKISAPLNTSLPVRTIIRNISNITRTNVVVNFNVTGANTFNTNQTIPSLAAGASTLITFTGFNPQNLGVNTISLSVPNDQNNLNNAIVYSQSVTCNRWANNPPGTYTTQVLGFTAGTGIITSPYLNPINAALTGIRGAIGNLTTSINLPVCAALLDATGNLIAMTNTLTMTSGNLGTFQDFLFASPVNLNANTLYNLGLVQLTSGISIVGLLGTNYIASNLYSYVGGTTGGALIVLTTNFGYIGIEAIYANAPVSLVSSPTVVCLGNCATVVAPSTISNYTWSSGGNTSSITACPASATNNTFSVVGTTTLGCPASGSIAVAVNPLPNITLSSITNSVCVGGTFSFTANGANTYSLGGVTTSSAMTQSPGTNTIYTVSGTNANNCVNSATIGVSIATLSVTVGSNTTICKGKTINITASGPAHYTYSWFLGSLTLPFASAQVNPTVTSSYTLTASDGFCSQTNVVTVSVSPVPSVTLSSSKPTSCRGESVTISGNSVGTYSWSSGGLNTASITVAPLVTTVYNTTVTNTDGCSGTAQITQNVVICTSIATNEASANTISIWPNPNNGSFIVNDDHFTQNKIIEIYNNLGEMVTRNEINNNKTAIDLTSAANGIYFVRIIADNQIVQISKIIKQ